MTLKHSLYILKNCLLKFINRIICAYTILDSIYDAPISFPSTISLFFSNSNLNCFFAAFNANISPLKQFLQLRNNRRYPDLAADIN